MSIAEIKQGVDLACATSEECGVVITPAMSTREALQAISGMQKVCWANRGGTGCPVECELLRSKSVLQKDV